ncbi:MAG: caspase family protein [Candidatus Zixiibacteriota bacterium]
MDEHIIYKNQDVLNTGQPVTHAIVIGIGKYDHLVGGAGNETRLSGGLGQLSSPPISAGKFADWLLDEFNNPQKPLATVSMLISDVAGPVTYQHAKLAAPVEVSEATIDNVKSAVRQWITYGNDSEENMTIFFFCGHGVARGLVGLTLLLSDYGKDDLQPMEGALDFAAMFQGMAQCKASQQVYFVDACRKVCDIAARTTDTGNPIIQDDKNRRYASPWNTAVYHSALKGEAAYGRKDLPSFFTEELIKALNGLASNKRNAEQKWRICTAELLTPINKGLSLLGEASSRPEATNSIFEFHELKNEPQALALVYCKPKTKNKEVELRCLKNNALYSSREPKDEDWQVFVSPGGMYDFEARVDTEKKGEGLGYFILPPYQDVEIEVVS